MRTVMGRASRRGVAWARLAAVIALAAGASLLVVTPAAGSTVVASEPRVHQTLDDAPGWVTVAFDADVESAVAKMIVQGPDGENVTTGSLIVEGTNVTSQLRDDLPQGTYTVHYRINAPDGDVEGGAFQFAYISGSFTDLPDQRWSGSGNEPPILRGTDPNTDADPDASPTSTPPDVEVERSDGKTETPDPGRTTTQPTSGGGAEPTGGEAATDQPTDASTATSESPNRLPLIVGGAVLVIAIGAGAVALGLRGRGGGQGGLEG